MQAQEMLGLTATLNTSFEAALERVTAALKTEGFGILTEIDVKIPSRRSWTLISGPTKSSARATHRWPIVR